MSTENGLSQAREWVTFTVAIIAAIAAVIFWVQNANNDKIQRIDEEVTELKKDLKAITKQNSEILRLIGRIEGSMDR